MAFESFARQWGTQLTARVRVVSQVGLAAVAMRTYDDYVAELPVTTTFVVCELDGIGPRAVLQFPHTDALTWIAHMLGAGPTIPVVDRKFTDVERTLVTSLLTETLRDLRHSMGRLLESPLRISSIQHNSQFAQAAPTAELMIVAELDLRVGSARAGPPSPCRRSRSSRTSARPTRRTTPPTRPGARASTSPAPSSTSPSSCPPRP